MPLRNAVDVERPAHTVCDHGNVTPLVGPRWSRGGDREQVRHDRFEGKDDRAGHQEEHDVGHHEYEGERVQHVRRDESDHVEVAGGLTEYTRALAEITVATGKELRQCRGPRGQSSGLE